MLGRVLTPMMILGFGIVVAPVSGADQALPEVGSVNGEEITPRQLETELLRREGKDLLLELLSDRLDQLRWAEVGDQDVVFSIAGHDIRRIDLTAKLLHDHGAKVRTELMNIMIARQRLDRAGIEATPAVLNAEWQRMQKESEAKLEEGAEAKMPFEEYLRVQRGISREQFMQEEGFVMAARLHAYVHAHTPLRQDKLELHYLNHPERFTTPAARRVSVIYVPYQTRQLGAQTVVDPEHRRKLPGILRGIRDRIATGKQSFASAWKYFGKSYDPQSEHGQVGWVTADGTAERFGARSLHPDTAAAVFSADLSAGPVLLPVIAHEKGCAIVRVEAHRAKVEPMFGHIIAAVRSDYIEERLAVLTQQVSVEWSRDAQLEFGELHRLIEGRQQQARQLPDQVSGGDAASASAGVSAGVSAERPQSEPQPAL